MTALGKTLDQVSGLLGELPGVSVVRSELHGGQANIEIVISGAANFAVLQQLSLGANVAFEPLRRPSQAFGINDPPPSYALAANTAQRDLAEFGALQLLGIQLAWHLHKIGLLATPRANTLLRNWRGAAVGA